MTAGVEHSRGRGRVTSVKTQFEEMFPWEFAQALREAPICYLPLGVLEWHGEHNAVGLDTLKSARGLR